MTYTCHDINGCTVYHADAFDVLADLRPASIEAVVTDPPYHLTTAGRFGRPGAAPPKDRDGAFARQAAGFMGQQWDGGDVAFRADTWRAVLRVLKPGGHVAVFGHPRTHHRVMTALEDAGFEIRDCLMWLFGTGFPKSVNVSKAMDKANGANRPVTGTPDGARRQGAPRYRPLYKGGMPWSGHGLTETAAATDEAAAWEGWGTALKPGYEPIILARRPLDGTVVQTARQWGTGAINIDACRIPTGAPSVQRRASAASSGLCGRYGGRDAETEGRLRSNPDQDKKLAHYLQPRPGEAQGRYPADVLHDGAIREASRFFYSAKAGAQDRQCGPRGRTSHPTVKPISLMRWLVRLVTPSTGTVLDPFAGSGTTLAAAMAEGVTAIGVERDDTYVADILARCRAGPPTDGHTARRDDAPAASRQQTFDFEGVNNA